VEGNARKAFAGDGQELSVQIEALNSVAVAEKLEFLSVPHATSRSVRASRTRERITAVSFSTSPLVVLPRVQRVVERRRLGEHGHRIVRRTSWFDGS
jgi:hypothetical protein